MNVTPRPPTALIADDEPLLRTGLERRLGLAWPALEVLAQARNGLEAVEQFELHRPDICFLDVHMPGMSGVEAARHIGRRAHLVFVTAHRHAIGAQAAVGAAQDLGPVAGGQRVDVTSSAGWFLSPRRSSISSTTSCA